MLIKAKFPLRKRTPLIKKNNNTINFQHFVERVKNPKEMIDQELKSQADRVRRSAARGISTAKRKKMKGENLDHRVFGANLEGATANAS